MISLKILSNLVEKSTEAAAKVSESSLLPLLTSMIYHPVYQEEEIMANKIMVNMLHSLGACDYKLPTDVYELHRPPLGEQPVLDIVFVHGLRGTAFKTWRQKDKKGMKTTLFWPKVRRGKLNYSCNKIKSD
jgi:hypothetical protein